MSSWLKFATLAFVGVALVPSAAPRADTAPQSVNDIAAVLEHEKPDPQRTAKLEQQASKPAPSVSARDEK